jgi:hypothetical protein
MFGRSLHQPAREGESPLDLSSNELDSNLLVVQWDHNNPEDRSRWETQHNGLRDFGPPYVYHVVKGDTQGFVQAVKDAIANPIDRWVYQAAG